MATVGEAADQVGVTVRALHHWDEIGLVPSMRSASGYRMYTAAGIDRLHRVVAYRAAGLGLDAIKALLDDVASEITATLQQQRAQLRERIDDLRQLDDRLARMTDAHEHGILLSPQEQVETFGPDWDPARSGIARAAWGDSAQWAQFAERSATRSHAQWQTLSTGMRNLQRDLAEAMTAGVVPGSSEADVLVEQHRILFSNFFPLTTEMQVCLARMFEADEGFAAYYNGIRDGLANWFRRSVDESARRHGIDPNQAVWQ